MRFLIMAFVCLSLETAWAGGIRLEDFDYPFPVHTFHITGQKQDLEMAYMDVSSATGTAGAVVLLHGKNFCGAYWEDTAEALRDEGFRVIIPDQVGFGKSSKPEHYQFTFQQLADNTHALLNSLGVTTAQVVGHSMGGMLAVRYALMYPGETRALVLVDPIGLEDWKAKGVPYTTVDDECQKELKQTRESIRAYELENYYHGEWKPEYDRWVDMQASFSASPDYLSMAWDQALTYDMIYTQPVCYEFAHVKAPTLLIVGDEDRTAIGKDLAPAAVKESLGDYPALGLDAAASMPNAKLFEMKGVGHVPHVEAFEQFILPVKDFLKTNAAAP